MLRFKESVDFALVPFKNFNAVESISYFLFYLF